ncbi:MAG: radical SAM protein [Candidatus Pacearchaeota archaeon]|nr:radical SAM protein [Candidatus Pacearchaeota archaeon]
MNTKEQLRKKFPVIFKEKAIGFVNGVTGWYIENATPGLHTLDIEHIPEDVVLAHNDPKSEASVASEYRRKLCLHKCPSCFNEDNVVYSKENRILTLDETLGLVNQAIEIARAEGYNFESVKFLGPGELLMNPDLFRIIKEYDRRRVKLNIFTKGALLGDDALAKRYQGVTAKQLTDKLADCENVGLLFSFQSFDEELQDSLVTSKSEQGIVGLQGYTKIREKALENLFASKFYTQGRTNRVCIINAPIVPENIGESFDIYEFFVRRGTLVVMTPSMLSGKGCGQMERQKAQISQEEWHNKLVELYARIYGLNVKLGIQTPEQITREGIASYVGAQPCNQASTGLYIRANGIVQMCPGRFDKTTIFGSVLEDKLKKIWDASPNKARGIKDPHCLVNNRCPAKDGLVFPDDFYDRVMRRYEKISGK